MTNHSRLDLILSELQQLNATLQRRLPVTDKNSVDIALNTKDQTDTTDKNILLIAESVTELSKRVNMAIPLFDKTAAYEIKMDYLTLKVKKLETYIAELKTRIA